MVGRRRPGQAPDGLQFRPSRPGGRRSGAAALETVPRISGCTPGPATLCLSNGRIRVTLNWKTASASGAGQAVTLSSDTGYFWFFDPNNVEVVTKVIDGRPLNGHFWVFYGALSNVEYTLTVTDTQTGQSRTYTNPAGRLESRADTAALPAS
jgi:hypothetical protein